MSRPSSALIEHIYRMAGVYTDTTSSDAELMQRYADMRDERAFSSLMVRHGLMVWSICHRILCNTQDAEEAYQTTFLALAHKAKKVRGENLVAWLHHVAQQTAAAVRRKALSRDKAQKSFQSSNQRNGTPEADDSLYEDLHSEIAKLPEKVRVALVLHYLEGKTQAEVGHILGIAEPSVRDRLNRGRRLLEKRLSEHGLAIGLTTLSSLLAESLCKAAIPPGLVNKTVKAATAFRDGNLSGGLAKLAQEMLKHTPCRPPWWKTGWIIAILCGGALGVGAGGIAWRTGFFGTKADQQPAGSKPNVREHAEKVEAKPPRLDRYGDPLPAGALARLGAVRFRHDTFSSDTSRLVPTADKKLIIPGSTFVDQVYPLRCYDLSSGKAVTQFQDAEGRMVLFDSGATVSADGRLVVQTNPANGDVSFWDIAARQRLNLGLKSLPAEATFSPDRKTITALNVSGPAANRIELFVWNRDGKNVWATDGFSSRPLQLSYTSDGKVLMAACPPDVRKQPPPETLTIRRWEAVTGKALPSWTISGAGAYAWSRDGSVLALSSKFRGDAIGVWNAATGTKIQGLQLEAKVQVLSLALSADGKILAGSMFKRGDRGVGCFLCLWKTATGELIRRWSSPSGMAARLAFSSDDASLILVPGATATNRFIYVWDAASGKIINQAWQERGHEDEIAALGFSPEGDALTSLGSDAGLIRWTANPTGDGYSIHSARTFHDDSPLRTTAFGICAVSADGKLAAYADNDGPQAHVRVWDVLKDQEAKAVPAPARGAVGRLRISQDNKSLGLTNIVFRGGGIHLHDFSTGRRERELAPAAYFAFSPNGKWIAAGSIGENLCLWDRATGATIAKAPVGHIFDLAFSPDSRTLAVSSRAEHRSDNAINLWRVCSYGSSTRLEGPCQLAMVKTHIFGELSSLTFSPTGRTLAAARRKAQSNRHHASDAVIHLWETATGQQRQCFNEGGSAAQCLAFTQDGRRLASGHEDATILLWDATGRMEAAKLRPARLSASATASLWEDLADADAQRANRAVWELAAGGASTVAFFKTHLQSVKRQEKPPAKDLARWITDLDDEAFAVRQTAIKNLKRRGIAAEPELREALQGKISRDMRNSVESLLKRLEEERTKGMSASGENLRTIRALEVLQEIDDNDACRMLRALSSGKPDAPLTREAQAALDNWSRMHQQPQKAQGR